MRVETPTHEVSMVGYSEDVIRRHCIEVGLNFQTKLACDARGVSEGESAANGNMSTLI